MNDCTQFHLSLVQEGQMRPSTSYVALCFSQVVQACEYVRIKIEWTKREARKKKKVGDVSKRAVSYAPTLDLKILESTIRTISFIRRKWQASTRRSKQVLVNNSGELGSVRVVRYEWRVSHAV